MNLAVYLIAVNVRCSDYALCEAMFTAQRRRSVIQQRSFDITGELNRNTEAGTRAPYLASGSRQLQHSPRRATLVAR